MMNVKQIANEVLLPEVAALIREGHTVTLLVRGNSMNPFMVDRRDKVVLGSVLDEELKPGAVVLAHEREGRMVLHRIVARNGGLLTLQGDGNVGQTEEAETGEVMGVMLAVVRKGKTYACRGRAWRWYSAVWMRTLFMRRIVLGVWRRTRRTKILYTH
jgi:hypothetical protein